MPSIDMDANLPWKEILELFRFPDWIMALTENLEKRFSDDIHQYDIP